MTCPFAVSRRVSCWLFAVCTWLHSGLSGVEPNTTPPATSPPGVAALVAPPPPADDQPIELEAFVVLGSRIRLLQQSGPSPVNNYGLEDIAQTGAMTLADFLSRLPQNYSGIGAGRGSTPDELNPEFGSRTETANPPINLSTGAFAPAANATGHSGVSLRGLGSGATLILVDGRRMAKSSVGNQGTDSRQGYVDLNSIPLGMVERIEVITDGASALYGADAVAGVINIVLRKNWSGTELSLAYKGSFAGGGAEMNTSLVHGFSSGKLRGSVSIDYYNRSALKADQRPFSASQNHTAIIKGYDPVTGAPLYGSNYLLNWGYPATVQARSGNLAGILGPTGLPTRVALTPDGLTAPPTTTDGFVGVSSPNPATPAEPSRARTGNTAAFLDLIPPSERAGTSLRLTYKLPADLELYGSLLHTRSDGSSSGQPPAFAVAAFTGSGRVATIVPAAYNPFNQDVLVGMIAYEFGAIRQNLSNRSLNSTLGITGFAAKSWRWDLAVGWQQQDFARSTRDFNPALVTAALANPDPALRINPFIDARAAGAPSQADLWENMARYIRFDGLSELLTIDFATDGEVLTWRGGEVRMAAGFYFEHAAIDNRSVTPSATLIPVDTIVESSGSADSFAVFSELMIPFVSEADAKPWLERLDLQLALRHEDRGSAGSATVPKFGVSWVPVKSLLLRAGYTEGFRAPGLTETLARLNDFNSNALIDPRRGNAQSSGVLVTRAANPNLRPETSQSLYCGLLFEPSWLPGFELDVSYYVTKQNDIIQILTEQVLVNNEASFPDRVVRADPDPSDIANGWPGRILSVNRSLLNFGRSENHSLDFMAHYRMPQSRFGKFTLSINASHTLKSLREITPGVAPIDDLGDTFSPPKWRLGGSVNWSGGNYNASLFASHLSSFGSNRAGSLRANQPVPAQLTVDLRVGYTFKRHWFANFGANSRVSLGIGNLFDEKPPFADTVFGYNGSFQSPLGRTFQLSCTLPF
jgi:iron complex outermembrane recepter protein